MKKPLVSVVVTTKNEENNIERLLASIKKQTYKNVEIIVVDNSSTDKTKKISGKYTDNIFNKGPERSAQRNYGALKSKGSYLVFLDADMELSKKVIESCVEEIEGHKALIIPETTTGNTLMAKIRRFEREMYMGDATIEVARFFERNVFVEFGGYDENLTGPEDYDLPYRISKKYSIGWAKEYILHHEEGLTLLNLLRKKYRYALKGSTYAFKHPELIASQGNLLFRKVYFKNWIKFVKHPLLGFSFIFVRVLETIWAVAGFIKKEGFLGFSKVLFKMFTINYD